MRHGRTILPTLIVMAASVGTFMQPVFGAGPTDDRLGERTVPIFLLSRPDIQADLKLSPEQVAECQRAARVFQLRASKLVGRKDPAVVAARRAIDEELTQWLTQRLSPQQLARFEQVDLQWEGAGAMLSRPFLDEGLNLTPAQKKQVLDMVDQTKVQRARGTWTFDDHVNLTRKALAVLTPPQRDLWIRKLGPECHFSIAAKANTALRQPAVSASPGLSAPRR